jgi:TetR/AcrR family transcriptional regulator
MRIQGFEQLKEMGLEGFSLAKRVRRTAAISKSRIIAAAIKEFSAKGYDGARVDEVSARSGVNKTLLYQYIGNKDDLFTAALEVVYQTIREQQRDLLIREMTPETGVRKLIEFMMKIWVDHPEFGRLIANENFLGGKHVKKSAAIKEMYKPLLETLNSLVKRGAKQGMFRRNIDPIDLYITISGLSAYYISHQFTFDTVFNTHLMAPRRLHQRERHVVDVVMAYLRV